MIPAAILVIIDLIIVSTFTLYNIFKNREQDRRIDVLEEITDAAVRELQRLTDRPIVTPPPKSNMRI